jgi:hypothetical protein
MSRLVRFSAIGLLVLTACLEANAPEQIVGDWGGQHLGLVANAAGADLEYDCAAGKIAEPIRPDAAGRFSVIGEHYPGHGGPSLIGEQQVKRPARYDGSVRGGSMTLEVTLTDTQELLGTFKLVYGASPHVFKCL